MPKRHKRKAARAAAQKIFLKGREDAGTGERKSIPALLDPNKKTLIVDDAFLAMARQFEREQILVESVSEMDDVDDDEKHSDRKLRFVALLAQVQDAPVDGDYVQISWAWALQESKTFQRKCASSSPVTFQELQQMQLKNNLDSLTKYKPNFNIPKAWSAGLMQSIRESLGADQAFLFCYIASDGPAMAEVYMTQPLPKR